MAERKFETTAAFKELIDLIRDGDALFLEGPRAVDDASVLEGYRWLTEILSVALDCYLWADEARPTVVPIVGPTRKFGGDNADAMYTFAPLHPERSYRVRGVRGDACYLSLTVYGGPRDGRWSDRIVATLNDRSIQFGPDGSFEVLLSAREQPGNWIKLDSDSVALITRDYLVHPRSDRPASFSIECLDEVAPPRLSDEDLARRLHAAANFIRDMLKITPLPLDRSKLNQIDQPYGVPQRTYGWAAGDAAYAMGSFELRPDQALVLTGRSPRCVFWNVVLWNPYLQTYDYRYEQVTLNGGQVRYEPDGSWRIVIAARDPGVSNWISTADHSSGRIWFRWFLPENLPERPTALVTPITSLRSAVR